MLSAMRTILLVGALLAPSLAVAADIDLSLHQSYVLSVSGEVTDISLDDPRVLSAQAIPQVHKAGETATSARFHLQGIGPGSTEVTATLASGHQQTWAVTVSKKKIKGKPTHTLQRGRGLIVEFEEPPHYAATGDSSIVYARPFEGANRYQLIGIGEGTTDLLLVSESGEVSPLVVAVDPKATMEDHEGVSLRTGQVQKLALKGRPTSVAVSNGQIAKAKVHREGTRYAVAVTAMSAGVTDLMVSLGADTPVRYWTITVY